MKLFKRQSDLYVMIIPGVILAAIFYYIPIFGNIIAFMNYVPLLGLKGSTWVGMQNFIYVFSLPDTLQIVWNTVYISVLKIIFGLAVPIVIALFMNEVAGAAFKRGVQTIVYLPHFMSWIILGGVFLDLLDLHGPVNNLIGLFGISPIYFLGDNHWFPLTMVATDTWKEAGFSTIIYMAALTSIDPTLYEAAMVDGANRWKQTLHVTLPGMRAIIVLMGTLSLGNILNANFDQIFTMYSPQVYKSGDILDTFVYRLGLTEAQYGPAAAVGLFKSAISCVLIAFSYFLASKYANYRIF